MKKFLSLFLCVIMVFSTSSIAFAASPTEDFTEAGFSSEQRRVTEIPELREKNSDTYLLSDGSYECVIYAEDKYYQDAKGEYIEINNDIVPVKYKSAETTYNYVNAANSTKVYFAKDNPAVLIMSGNNELTFSLIGSNATNTSVGERSNKCKFDDLDLQNGNCITYTDVYKGTDLVYSVNNGFVKEYLVLSDSSSPSEYLFEFDTSSCVIKKNDAGTLNVYDSAGELSFELGSLFAVDSAGAYTDALEYEIVRKDNDATTVKLMIDPAYLNDSSRVFPVLIDPSIMITGGARTYDTYVSSRYPTSNYYLQNWLRTGRDEDYYIRRTYIKFDLPSGITSSNVTSAYINIKKYSGSTPSVKAYRATGNWTSSTLTWDNKPGYTTTNASATASLYSNNWYRMYVTNIVKSWYTGTYSNYGFVLKDATESGTSQWTTFYSSDAASPNKPELVINYNWPDHAYAGFNRGGSNKGVSATITLPSKLPNVSDSGESVWVSTSKDSNGEWVQTGARYYSTFTNFKTYTEHYQSGVYKLTTVGVHALGASISYKVEYNSTDGKWHAYIAGVDKVSSALATINNGVQGNAETHKRNIEMGPFTFSNVKIKNSSGTWVNNTTTPSAYLPYIVTGTATNFTVSGP